MWLKFLTAASLSILTAPLHAFELSPQQNETMRAAQVIILGEIHDNPQHHLVQAHFISELQPTAVVFEMLSPFMANQVNAFAGQDFSSLGAEIGWQEAGWPDFAIYQPIFEAMGDAHASGAAAPQKMVRQAFSDGAAAVFEGDASQFGLTEDVPPEQLEARKQLQFDAHCQAMPIEMMGGMVEAQRFRDAHFAARTLLALETYGAPVVVITGNGHARKDWGMPQMLLTAAPKVSVFSLGMLEHPAENASGQYDATIVTDPAERGEPCAAFKN